MRADGAGPGATGLDPVATADPGAGGAAQPPSATARTTATPSPRCRSANPVIAVRFMARPLFDSGAKPQEARPWHILNFLPEPHGQGAFRPTPAYGSAVAVADLVASPVSLGAE